MTDQPLSLASLVTSTKELEFDVPGFEGFKMNICFLSREEKAKLYKSCIVQTFDRKSQTAVDTMNDEKFVVEYCAKVIKGWTGLKFKYVEELLLADISDLNPEDELPFTKDNAVTLMKNSEMIDKWVTEVTDNLGNFTTGK